MEDHAESPLRFEAAVERPLSAVFRTADGRWEGHDYTVQVIATRLGLDGFDVVVDFRALEAALETLLAPFQGRLLPELGVPAPARISEVALTDGQGRRLSLRP